ncbi:hypothetical protein HIM_10074 [Hirsutella minnesotensis 3608]|uniref:ubiquitinyl hydrolase 1 n=1 Tax=Hirsutella minnesotensis 3608 TaxID=1043627 RepID=A0A0F7ZKG2_9HYPO|nr:hypothetical protein HIM_10074 [Hirsutella minnesotensis 3608]
MENLDDLDASLQRLAVTEEAAIFSRAGITYAVEHVILPTKLPQNRDDEFIALHESSLLRAVSRSLEIFAGQVGPNSREAILRAHSAIELFQTIRNDDGFIGENALLKAFQSLKDGDVLPIQVTAQNAGIIVTRDVQSVVFEPFELSPRNSDVVNTIGRLVRTFPALSVAVSNKIFQDHEFLASLSHTIAKLSIQEAAQAKPMIKKAQQMQIEERDSVDPKFVSDFLMSVLHAVGETVETRTVTKNTREEVLWSDALLPWRRSPLWLFVRVTLDLFLSRQESNAPLYKQFMVVFMSGLLQSGTDHELPSDILHCIIAKISRRLVKLDILDQSYPWLSMVKKALSTSRNHIEYRWKCIMRESAVELPPTSFSVRQVTEGTHLSLTDLDDFLEQTRSRTLLDANTSFVPSNPSLWFEKDVLPSLQNHSDFNSHAEVNHARLWEFERWITENLDSWVNARMKDRDVCDLLLVVMKDYHELAADHYSGNPEGQSIMLLTIMEIWIAADKTACAWDSMLNDFNPEIPVEILQSLLLPRRREMERLARVEHYVETRRSQAGCQTPSIFSFFGDSSSFQVRYFNKSREHQTLLRNVEELASREREEKRAEFRKLREEYNRLINLVDRAECETYTWINQRTGIMETRHYKKCQRCKNSATAASMQISVHEWPLPKNREKAKAVVFELDVPRMFRAWRDMSLYVRINVLSFEYSESDSEKTDWDLQKYLPRWYKTTPARVKAVSSTKPHRGTHRNMRMLSTVSEDAILLDNGMTYHYLDKSNSTYLTEILITDKIAQTLAFKLPKCGSLQDFLFRPNHRPDGLTPNTVISQQASCPDHLTLEEFRAMASVPFGHRIQWFNILVNLHASSLDLKKVETLLILLQTSLQAGPPQSGSVLRAAHQVPDELEFASRLLQGLSLALTRTKENWESVFALSALVLLATRLMDLTSSHTVSRQCIDFLGNCRQVTLKWMRDLQHKAKVCEDDHQRTEYHDRIFHVAHVCASSFDTGLESLSSTLEDSAEASILIETSMAIKGTFSCVIDPASVFVRMSMDRWRRLLHTCQPLFIREIIHRHSSCLDEAIRKTWSIYEGSQGWTELSSRANYWLTTLMTRNNMESHGMVLHFNLLTAEFLVNGMPLSRMPPEFEAHPSYRTFFGSMLVEVMPTTEPGMRFSAKNTHHGYTMSFGINSLCSRDFLITASKEGKIFDLVPARVFDRELPHYFVQDHVHWYNRQSETIEFRRKDQPWLSSDSSWILQRKDCHWILRKGSQTLLRPGSCVAQALAKVLNPIETELFIHISHRSDTNRLSLELRRLQIDFFQSPESN